MYLTLQQVTKMKNEAELENLPREMSYNCLK